MDMFTSYGHIKKPKCLHHMVILRSQNKITDFFYNFSLGLRIRKLVSFLKMWLFAAASVVNITDISFFYQFESIL